MFNLLIVDDERRDRNVIRILIGKQYPDTFRIIEAENGKEALKILDSGSVDLMILDMNMPAMSGVDVLKKSKRSVYTIILTAYSYFDYAQTAVRNGVSDYILKPPIRTELYSAVDRFLQTAGSHNDLLSKWQKILEQGLADQLLFFGSPEKTKEYLSILNLEDKPVSLLIIKTPRGEDITAKKSLLENELSSHLSIKTLITKTVQNTLIIIAFRNSGNDVRELENFISSCTHKHNLSVRYNLLIPSCADIPRYYSELSEHDPESSAAVSKNLKSLEKAILGNDISKAMEYIYAEIGNNGLHLSADISKLNIISMLSTATRHTFLNADKHGAYTKLSTLLNSSGNEELMDGCFNYLSWLINEIMTATSNNTYVVTKTLELIENDCAQNWTLDRIAADFKISPYYLSHLFKKQTGVSFSDYLSEIRIEKAIEYMKDSSLSLSKIGEAVGYTDQNYFSRVFKKRKGISASHFRRQLL